MNISKLDRKILVDGYLPPGTSEVRIRIRSSRNKDISRISDVSKKHPNYDAVVSEADGDVFAKRFEGEITYAKGGEIWFPVVDVELTPSMYGTVTFPPDTTGRYAINGFFHRKNRPFDGNIEIPACELEYWENSLFLQPSDIQLEDFYLTAKYLNIPSLQSRFQYMINTLSEDWNGEIQVYSAKDSEETLLASGTIINSPPKASASTSPARDLDKALAATVNYVLNSRNLNPASPTFNGLNLFYDLEAGTYRNSNWIWSWGPAIKLLVEYAKSDAGAKTHSKDELVRIADEIAMTSTKFQIDNPGHVADGLGSPRWQTDHMSGVGNDFGYVELLAGGADSNFLSGWAWIPLYEETGNEHYLSCAEKLADTTWRLINQYDIIPQDYISEINDWTDRTLNESLFGMEGLAELYRVTSKDRHYKTGEKYIEQHVDKLLRDDGLWDFGYFNETEERVFIKNTRGLGWAMEGLLASHRMMPEGRYLEMAERLADHIIKWQHPAGFLACVIDESPDTAGIDDKSTPLWSMLLYRLYKHTAKKEHLDAARRAMNWSVDNLYYGSDSHAYGGLVGINRFSGVSYRRWFPLTCLYSSAFLGLAILEEMSL